MLSDLIGLLRAVAAVALHVAGTRLLRTAQWLVPEDVEHRTEDA